MRFYQSKFILTTVLLSCVCNAVRANYFDTLNHIASRAERLSCAKWIYYENRMGRNSVNVPAAYQELTKIAGEKKDHGLEAFAEIILAAYYSSPAFANEYKADKHFENALRLANKSSLHEMEAETYHQMGWNYYWQKKYAFAFEYFLKANSLIRKMGYKNYYFVNKHLYDIGFMYYDFGNFKKAKEYLLESVKYPVPSRWYLIDNYNTLGLVYRELKIEDSAILYFKKTIEIARECRDTAWVGVATGNIAYIYYRQKNYNEAITMFLTDYQISKKNNDYNSLATVLNSVIRIYTKQKNFTLAADYMNELDTVIKEVNSQGILWHYFILKAQLSAVKKDFTNAYRYMDSATRYREQLMQRNDAHVISQAEQKVEVEKHLADINLLESERDKQVLLRNAIITGTILFLIIAIQFFLRLRAAHKRDLEVLNSAKSQLKHYIASIREKNQLIEGFRREIDRLNSLPNSPTQLEKGEILEKLQSATILTDDDWDEFKRLFEKVHKDFFMKLKLRYPDLTNGEMRLMALAKLNLSRKEMAEMLGISPDSIKKTRQRINKKLNLPEDETLDQLVWKL